MMRNLTRGATTKRVLNATAAGTTTVNTSSIDTLGYEAARFVAGFGTLTATQVTNLKIQSSPDNATWTDVTAGVTANMLDADSNKLLIAEIYRPPQRYLRGTVVRGTANAVIDFVIAELFLAQREPCPVDATVSQQVINQYGQSSVS
jgi:hypothetical protein